MVKRAGLHTRPSEDPFSTSIAGHMGLYRDWMTDFRNIDYGHSNCEHAGGEFDFLVLLKLYDNFVFIIIMIAVRIFQKNPPYTHYHENSLFPVLSEQVTSKE